MTYSGRIIREQGASVLTVASGGSINVSSGGALASSGTPVFSGGFTLGQGSAVGLAGGLQTMQTGASFTMNVTTADQGTLKLSDGTRSATFGIGREAPTHTASPGSVHVRSDGSMSNWYYNISSGTTGSVWRAAASA